MSDIKTVEEIVEQYAQSVQDMYFLAGAKVSVETWKNTKDFLRNALTQYHQDLMSEVVAMRVKDGDKGLTGVGADGYNQAIDDIIKSK